MAQLQGRTALVTGASRGIGRAIATRLAADGARVAVHYNGSADAANEVVDTIRRDGGQAVTVRADLSAGDGVEQVVSQLLPWLGGGQLDVLVNNAALFGGTLEEADGTEFDRMFAVNVRAPFFLVQRLLPVLGKGSRVVNISSGVTWMAIPQVVYSMTKGAVDVMTRTLAKSLGPQGITVNSVSPGITDTDMNPWMEVDAEATANAIAMTALGRIGAPADIADAVAFFASDDARWVTGQRIDVAGGLFLGP
ncbi:SDR family NAD(P)-dependent oxidoreductase [Streptomyces sp. WELS2]|uniref:SDR family NAD(P)-dependent oxidoreductase n=1 Tax=Streptomyces sp. WELS2 TaxID=2749435 RepID=UPI0015F0E655|nr:SDR family oxidoreductase [Streptomyces sp. WELS2]